MEQDKRSQEAKQSQCWGGAKVGTLGGLPWTPDNPRISGILTTPEAPRQIRSPEVLATRSPGGS